MSRTGDLRLVLESYKEPSNADSGRVIGTLDAPETSDVSPENLVADLPLLGRDSIESMHKKKVRPYKDA